MYCSAIKSETPSAAIRSMNSKMALTTSGASPSEASSTRTSFGFATYARTSASICCSPPLSVPAICDFRLPSTGKVSIARSKASRSCPFWTYNVRFSRTVSEGKMPRPSGMRHRPRRDRSYGLSRVMSSLPNVIDPCFGRARPAAMRSVVVLPCDDCSCDVVPKPAMSGEHRFRISCRAPRTHLGGPGVDPE